MIRRKRDTLAEYEVEIKLPRRAAVRTFISPPDRGRVFAEVHKSSTDQNLKVLIRNSLIFFHSGASIRHPKFLHSRWRTISVTPLNISYIDVGRLSHFRN